MLAHAKIRDKPETISKWQMADNLCRIVWKPYKFHNSRFQIRILESVNLEFEINAELYAEDDPDLWTCAKARETF
jgi:hypothetical protein